MSRHKTQSAARETDPLVSLSLAADDISALPGPLRERIAKTDAGMPGDWALVGTADPELAELVRRVLSRLPSMATIHQQELTDRNIELLIQSVLPDAPRAEVRAQLEMDNARLRADYLQETRTLSGAEVRGASGLNPKNPSEPTSRWKRERRVFAVRRGGRNLFPAFQFEDGQPRPVIKRILGEVPASATGWQIALWFASGNGWLDGAEPQNRLAAADEVVEAAWRLADRTEG